MPRHIWLAATLIIAFAILATLLYMEASERRKRVRAAAEKIAAPLGFDPAAIEAQASHESSNFLSIPPGSNNYFGIRWYGTRPELPYAWGTGSDGCLKYAKYRDIEHQMEEYCSMVKRLSAHQAGYKNRNNPEKYIEALSSTWCPEDEKYSLKWKAHYVKVKRMDAETLKAKEEKVPEKTSFKPVLKRLGRGLAAAAALWVSAELSPWVMELLANSPQYGAVFVALSMSVGKWARGLLYEKYPKAAEWFPI